MKRKEESYDVVVCGGGLAGLCAAVAAARLGARTCIIQDRPVFGGCSSSEIRVPVGGCGNYHVYARETGIIAELLIEERAKNHEPVDEGGWTNSVWDMVMYDLAMRTPNLTIHLNTAVQDVLLEGAEPGSFTPAEANTSRGYYFRPACSPSRRIEAVLARVANAELEVVIRGKHFIDCTGDSIVADRAGCEWRMGSEGKGEFNEIHAPEKPNCDTMGSTIHFKSKDIGRPAPYAAPDWAVRHDDARYFYDQGRYPYNVRCGYWWIEIGVPWHTIHDAEKIRYELTRHCLGVWDWLKNKDPRLKDKAKNYMLDWIGQVPGKRDSRRVAGLYLLNENDLQNKTTFPDEIAYAGWYVDLHTPGGLLAPTSEPVNADGGKADSKIMAKCYVGPYGIPLRSLISKDIDNLLFAGRNISVTHAALGSVRTMGTTSLMGQAAGTAAAIALRSGIPLAEVSKKAIREVQQRLLRDGSFVPSVRNEDAADLARGAGVRASSSARAWGAGPTSSSSSMRGLSLWRDQSVKGELNHRRGQWIAIGSSELNSLSVCLSNVTDQPQKVEARLYPVEHIWDYRSEPAAPLAVTTLTVPPGKQHWVEWRVALKNLPTGRYLRLDLMAQPQLLWHISDGLEPAHPSAFEMAPGKMKRFQYGPTLCYRVDPPQPCYGPENAINGVFRPHRFTNLWRSDPAQPLPQWLELSWPKPQRIQLVELTFPDHICLAYIHCPPFFRDPQCARDFAVEAWVDGAWHEVARAMDNYQRQCRLVLKAPVTTMKMRVVIEATNGDPSAAIYEVRCY